MIKTCTAIAEHNETQLENYQNKVKASCFECEFNPICNGGCPAHGNVIDASVAEALTTDLNDIDKNFLLSISSLIIIILLYLCS
jgi:sulfatase maturation enzyme AslB (radical SAM superfamily)